MKRTNLRLTETPLRPHRTQTGETDCSPTAEATRKACAATTPLAYASGGLGKGSNRQAGRRRPIGGFLRGARVAAGRGNEQPVRAAAGRVRRDGAGAGGTEGGNPRPAWSALDLGDAGGERERERGERSSN